MLGSPWYEYLVDGEGWTSSAGLVVPEHSAVSWCTHHRVLIKKASPLICSGISILMVGSLHNLIFSFYHV